VPGEIEVTERLFDVRGNAKEGNTMTQKKGQSGKKKRDQEKVWGRPATGALERRSENVGASQRPGRRYFLGNGVQQKTYHYERNGGAKSTLTPMGKRAHDARSSSQKERSKERVGEKKIKKEGGGV